MKSKLCPYKKHCHSSGDCESCDFGKAFERLYKKIKRLKQDNGALRAENKELKHRLEVITSPDF